MPFFSLTESFNDHISSTVPNEGKVTENARIIKIIWNMEVTMTKPV